MTKRIAAVVASLALAGSLAACGDEVKNAADKAKSQASEAVSSAGSQVKDKASEAASKAADKVKKQATDKVKDSSAFKDITSKLPADVQKKLAGLDGVALGDNGELAKDDDSVTVAEFFAARQAMAADTGVDRTQLEATSTGKALRSATVYVTENTGKNPKFEIKVVSSENGRVDVCVGPKAKTARTMIVEDGKVTRGVKADHTC